MSEPYEPLDPQITLTTLLRESDHRSYGYELPGHAPQIMGALIANYFDLDQHASRYVASHCWNMSAQMVRAVIGMRDPAIVPNWIQKFECQKTLDTASD